MHSTTSAQPASDTNEITFNEKTTIVKAVGGTLLFVPLVVWDALKKF